MFSDTGKEIIESLISNFSKKNIDYWIDYLAAMIQESESSGDVCCKHINPQGLCFSCFEHHLDKSLLRKMVKIQRKTFPNV